MQCKKCGTEIKNGCLFCHKCGEEVQIVPDYEPELDDLQIKLAGEKKKWPIEEQPEKQSDSDFEEKKESFLKTYWKQIVLTMAIVLGIAAFIVAYSSVLKNQEPGAILQTQIPETAKESKDLSGPEFSLPEGEYSYYISVELSAENAGTIYYTLDGTTPDETSYVYEAPINLPEGTTVIRAFVMDEEGNSSDIVSEVFRIEFGVPDQPTIFPESGDYVGEQYVRILVPEDCVAYYTLDGSDPTESSEIYTGEFLMPTGTTTVRAMLEDENGAVSEVSSVLYNCIPLEQ